jgi:CHAD domain-containing protein
LTRVHTRGAALTSVAELATTRRRWLLADAEHPVAELVDDRVSARTATTSRSWREVEVELVEDADRRVLDQIEGRLLKAGLRRSAAASKLAKLLADQLPEPQRPPSGSSAGAVVLRYLSAQVQAMRRYDPLVRRDAPDAVHQMRVAARRMRSTLQGFRRILDRDRTEELIGELRWVAAELGQARDAEVTADRFAALLAELPAEAKVGRAESDLVQTLHEQGGAAKATGVAALDSDRYLRLQDQLDALLADPPLLARASRPAERELPASLVRAYRRVERAMTHARALPQGEQRQEALHEARKSGKRLRYLLEASEPALGARVARTVRQLKSLQTVLGDYQDTVVARPRLRELADRAGEGWFTYGVLYGVELARAQRLEAEAGEEWERLRASGDVRVRG